MKVRTRLYITTILSVLLIVIYIAISGLTQTYANRSNQQQDHINQIFNEVVNLEFITSSYLNFFNERSLTQWKLQYENIQSLLDEEPTLSSELSSYLEEIHDSFDRVNLVGDRINESNTMDEELSRLLRHATIDLEIDTQVMLSKLNEINVEARLLEERIQKITNVVSLGTAIFIVVINIFLMQTNLRNILLPIQQLLAGVREIQAENYDYQIPMNEINTQANNKNELQLLANAFNDMASQLRLTMNGLSQELLLNQQITQNLRESEQNLRRAEQIGQTGSWVRDLKNELPHFSDEMYRITGTDKTAFIPTPENILSMIHPNDRALWSETMGNTIFTHQPVNIEVSIIRPEGDERRLHVIREVDCDANGNPIRIVGVAHDLTEERKIMQSLAEREQLLQTIMDNNPNMIYVVDHEGRLMMLNKALADKYGREPTEIIGKTDFDLAEMGVLDPKTAKAFNQDIMDVLENQTPKFIPEETGFEIDGEAVWMETLLTPFNLPGKQKMVLGVSVDITERVKALKQIQESEELYRDLFNAITDAIIVSDTHGNILSVNEETSNRLGYSTEELKTMNVKDIDAPRYGEFQEDTYDQLVENGPKTFRVHHVTKDGHEIPTEVKVILFSYHGKPSFLGICRDMTDWEEAQRLLQDREQLLSEVLDTNPNMVYLFNSQGRLELANRSMAEHLGVNDSALSTMSIAEMLKQGILTPDLAERMEKSNQMVIENNLQLVITDGFLPDRYGNPHWFHTLLSPFVQEGEPTKVLGVSINITERKKNEDHIRNMNQVLESMVQTRTQALAQANEELQSFAYSISHDLRAPLRAVNGFSQILIEEFEESLNDKGLRYLNLVRENALLMGNLINGLLEFSRKGRQAINKRPVNPGELVEQVLMDMIHEYPKHKAKVVINELPECNADILLLRQVYQNLISNAYKFTSKTENPIIEIGSKINDNQIIYFVRDNGVGFDMKHADRLFGVFQRLHRTDEFVGTGVGLAIVQRIILRHGGTIWAESSLNEGATFFFTLSTNSDLEE